MGWTWAHAAGDTQVSVGLYVAIPHSVSFDAHLLKQFATQTDVVVDEHDQCFIAMAPPVVFFIAVK
jgi:hypothetical protein